MRFFSLSVIKAKSAYRGQTLSQPGRSSGQTIRVLRANRKMILLAVQPLIGVCVGIQLHVTKISQMHFILFLARWDMVFSYQRLIVY